MQMLLAAMLIHAFHATLEDRIIALDGVGMNLAAYIFIRFVTDAFMARKVISEREIMAAFVGHHRGVFRNIGLNNWNDISGACAINMERANLPAFSIDKRQYSVLVAMAAPLNRAFLATRRMGSSMMQRGEGTLGPQTASDYLLVSTPWGRSKTTGRPIGAKRGCCSLATLPMCGTRPCVWGNRRNPSKRQVLLFARR
jgi:hypothetical protein